MESIYLPHKTGLMAGSMSVVERVSGQNVVYIIETKGFSMIYPKHVEQIIESFRNRRLDEQHMGVSLANLGISSISKHGL